MEFTKYKTDKSGSYITNIPYDEYIEILNIPSNVIIPGINEKFTSLINARLINSAIEEASKINGTVVIKSGKYKVSTIYMKSNVTLFIDKDAELTGESYEEAGSYKAVICGENISNFEITGGGVIKGQGLSFTNPSWDESKLFPLEYFNTKKRVIEARKRIRFGKKNVDRPHMLYFENCKDYSVNNIILQESASWTFVIARGENIEIRNLIIDNHMHVANTDGIDLKEANNVKISHCFIATGDDGIVLKPMLGDISDVLIRDCEICSFANSFKIGTETNYDVSNINISDCTFFIPEGMTYGYSAIAIESADGSNISDVNVTNIKCYGVSSPVLIWLGKRLRMERKRPGSIKNVLVKNMICENVELPSGLTGCTFEEKNYEPQNVVFENIDVTYRDTKEKLDIAPEVSEWSLSDYPDIVRISHIYKNSHEESDYYDLPNYGVYMRYGEAKLVNYRCTPRSCNKREF